MVCSLVKLDPDEAKFCLFLCSHVYERVCGALWGKKKMVQSFLMSCTGLCVCMHIWLTVCERACIDGRVFVLREREMEFPSFWVFNPLCLLWRFLKKASTGATGGGKVGQETRPPPSLLSYRGAPVLHVRGLKLGVFVFDSSTEVICIQQKCKVMLKKRPLHWNR